MSHTLHIVISDDNTGETIVGLKETIEVKTPSRSLATLLSEPYLISRLLDDSMKVMELRAELAG